MRVLLAAAVLTLGLSVSAADADNGYGTINGWGTMIDPDKDCSFVIEKDRVSIRVSGGAHGLSSELNRMSAPRILQTVRGEFTIEIQVDGTFEPGAAVFATRPGYNGAGVLLWQDDRNYIRLERAVYTPDEKSRHYVNFEQRVAGRLVRFGEPEDFEVDVSKPCYLRLERKGRQILGSARQSEDDDWHELTPKFAATLPDSVQIGLAAINASDKLFAPEFSHLKIKGDVVKLVAKENEDPYAVPDTDVDGLVAFIRRVKTMRPRTRDEYMAHAVKGPKALAAAAERILKADEVPAEARAIAKRVLFENEIKSISRLDETKQRALMEEILEFSSTSESVDDNGQLVSVLARSLEYAKRPEMAAEAYLAASELMSKSEAESLRERAEKMAGAARRMQLLGNEMQVTGKLTDGKEFDLASYRGKVVLIDFWATWCGPCIAELPNVKKYYELYHAKGCEVVGVCLDTSRDKLEKFVEEKDIPWVNLFEDEAGWDHPVATHYGVMGIPTVILLNAEGKAVSLQARGPELGRLLEEELGPVNSERLREVEEKLSKAMPTRPTRPDTTGGRPQSSVLSPTTLSDAQHLKNVGLGLHNYHSAFKQLPPRETGGQLSWRVHVLPFLGEQELYQEFKLDEDWDSEHNKKLVDRIPQVYAWASPDLAQEGKTRIVFPFHNQAIYHNRNHGSKFRDVLDGLSNTIMVLVADKDEAVTWTSPDDLVIELEKPRQGWSEGVNGEVPILMGSGAVVQLRNHLSDELVRYLLTRAGKEQIVSAEPLGAAPRSAEDNAVARLRRAHALREDGELDKARVEYQTALKMIEKISGNEIVKKPTSPDGVRFSIASVYLALANLEREAGNPAAQRSVWETLVDLLEKNPVPDDPVYWGVLGQGLFRVDRVEDSRIAIEKTVALRGEKEPTIDLGPRWWYLTMALAKTGETERARRIYDKLVEQAGTSPSESQKRFQREAAEKLGI